MTDDVRQVVENFLNAESALQELVARASALESSIRRIDEAKDSVSTAVTSLASGERSLADGAARLGELAEQMSGTAIKLREVTEQLGEIDQAKLLESNEQTQAVAHATATAVRADVQAVTTHVAELTRSSTDLHAAIGTSTETYAGSVGDLRTAVAELRDRTLGLEGRVSEVGSRVSDLTALTSRAHEDVGRVQAVVENDRVETTRYLQRLTGLLIVVALLSLGSIVVTLLQ